jgi:hypothetical protein
MPHNFLREGAFAVVLVSTVCSSTEEHFDTKIVAFGWNKRAQTFFKRQSLSMVSSAKFRLFGIPIKLPQKHARIVQKGRFKSRNAINFANGRDNEFL